MFIESTVSAPNLHELLHCMALAIHGIMQDSAKSIQKVYYDVFDERIVPLDSFSDTDNLPFVDAIRTFIDTIFYTENLSPECLIMTMVYISRLHNLSNLTIDATNWRKIVLSTMILASKVWEDLAVWNADFLDAFPALTTPHLAELEKVLLSLLKFNVSLKASEYAHYYFELRSLAINDFPLEPLTKKEEKRLESKSLTEEERIRQQYEEAIVS